MRSIRLATAAAVALAFAMPAQAATLTTLHSFNGSNGANPYSRLAFDAGGNLYGTTAGEPSGANGTVFRLAAGTHSFSTVVTFTGSNGRYPYGGLTFVGNDLYGTSFQGGAGSDHGTIFRIDTTTNTLNTVATFTGIPSRNPNSTMVADASGKLFGTFQYGAGIGGGVFGFDPATDELTLVKGFANTAADGNQPLGSMVMDAAGNIYGTTAYGGSFNSGVLFRIDPDGNFTKLIDFDYSSNGATPQTLTIGPDGTLYGTTLAGNPGGGFSTGTVFRYNIATGTLTNIALANNAYAYGGVIADAAGNLFGATYYGGANGTGSIFRIDAGTSTLTTLASFTGANGANVYGGLVADASGNLYGTTVYGGSGQGTVFRVSDAGFVTAMAPVPEPGTWAMMLGGMGLIGGAMRRRRTTALAAA